MSSPKLPTRNVVPSKRAATQNGLSEPPRAPTRPTQPFTDAQRTGLLKDMRATAAPVAVAVADDEELELEIQVDADEAVTPARKTASTNSHVAPRRTK